MKQRILCSLALVFSLQMLVGISPQAVMGATQCQHSSTQARVKLQGMSPWVKTLTVDPNTLWEVGSFHNQTGQYATDTEIKVYQSGNLIASVGNGHQFVFNTPGKTYTVQVTTRNQYGNACTDTARVVIRNLTQCQYSSTQARVQKNVKRDWTQHLYLPSLENMNGRYANVGSFHNHTGVFATDTVLQLTSPSGGTRRVTNASRVWLNEQGTHTLTVTTRNQYGNACTDTATITLGP